MARIRFTLFNEQIKKSSYSRYIKFDNSEISFQNFPFPPQREKDDNISKIRGDKVLAKHVMRVGKLKQKTRGDISIISRN